MKERTLHKQVRVIYRACRRIYGTEKTQDECLRVFKVVYPELLRIESSQEEIETLDEKINFALQEIVKSWHPQKRLKELCERIISFTGIPFDYDKKELITFLEAITPVAMRIRKLTPRECFRLQDVDDEDIDKILDSGISKSAAYKLAGNAITISPMYHIFRKLLVETEPELKPGDQLMLF